MKKLLVLLILLTGCTMSRVQIQDKQSAWIWFISEQKTKPITEESIDRVINEIKSLSTFEWAEWGTEQGLKWKLPPQFIADGFTGQCKDIAVFMIHALCDKLGYHPRNVKIVYVKILSGAHSMLDVRMPDGEWKRYNPVGVSFFGGIELALGKDKGEISWSETENKMIAFWYEEDK